MTPLPAERAPRAEHPDRPATAREVPVSVLARAAAVLDAVDRHGPVASLAAVSKETGLPRSTTHRMCGELVELGILVGSRAGYRLGPRLVALGGRAIAGLDVREVARPHMEDLAAASGGLTVQLGVLVGVDVMYVEVVRSASALRLGSRAGNRQPAHATAAGKAILAYAPSSVVQARLEAGLNRLTPRTIGTPAVLRRELATVRSAGIAYDREESAPGLVCAAAPVFGHGERVVGAIGLSGLDSRTLTSLAPAVRMTGLALSRTLGARRAHELAGHAAHAGHGTHAGHGAHGSHVGHASHGGHAHPEGRT